MAPIDIIVLVFAISAVVLVIAGYIYKVIKKIPTGECACCSKKRNVNRMLKNVKKELDEAKEECNCCHCNK